MGRLRIDRSGCRHRNHNDVAGRYNDRDLLSKWRPLGRNRHQTYEHAKELTGGLSKTAKDRVDLNSIPRKVPEVGQYQTSRLVRFVEELLKVAANLGDEAIREILTKKGMLVEIANDVIRRVRSGDRGGSPEMN